MTHFYKVCTICALVLLGCYVWTQWIQAINGRYSTYGLIVFDAWTGKIYNTSGTFVIDKDKDCLRLIDKRN